METKEPSCPFCRLPKERIVGSTNLCVAIQDAYPISPGHTLIIPKRHVGSFFDTSDAEKAELLHLLEEAKRDLAAKHKPDGFNIGINDGQAAGQTVMHLHIHLVPRYLGDREDPRGGVRWIFPEKADYWSNG